MSIRKVALVGGEYFHVFNRGNSKQIIFHDIQDYKRFIDLLYICNTSSKFNVQRMMRSKSLTLFDRERGDMLVAIGAYCLMPNHFHILITELSEKGISRFMQKISTAYSMYFNKKYNRTGGLFEGKFKSEHANNDVYLKYLFSYIHLNPIKLLQKDWKEKGIKDKKEALDFLAEYEYSSYLDFINKERYQNKIISMVNFPDYFQGIENFQKEIFTWLSHKDMK